MTPKEKKRTNRLPFYHGAAAALLSTLLSGCAVSSPVTVTPRSSVEQRLLVRSFERAVAQIDTTLFQGKQVALELHGLTGDAAFAKELLVAELQGKGVHIADKPEEAELHLKAFSTALGVDKSDSLLGIPALVLPVVGMPIPEIPFYKSIHNRGLAEVKIYVFDGRTGSFIQQSSPAIGEAKYDHYTLFIFINFTLKDIDKAVEKEEPEADQAG